VVLSPDGRTAASVGMLGKSITLWERATGKQRAELAGHAEMVFDVALSPDGRTLASGSMDGTVRLWDLPSGKEVGRFEGHRGWVLAVAFAPDGKTLVSGGADTTALIWDVAGRRAAPPARAADLTPKELESLWADLAGDAGKAYPAMGSLAAAPKQAVSFLKEHLGPAVAPPEAQLARLIGDLDSNDFATRQKATEELERLGDLATAALRKALDGSPSAELRRRAEKLLDAAENGPSAGEPLRALRAVELLEYVGTPEAGQLLDALSKGVPEARQTRDAKASLQRLAKRAPATP
jgi:hypothetical protein